jgi:hypothetical protein
MAGFDFTAAQFAGLVEQFPSMNVDKTVCYKDFCDEVGPVYCKTSCLCVQLCVCVCVCACAAVVNAVRGPLQAVCVYSCCECSDP